MKYEISELINIDKVQALTDSFCEAARIASAVVDLEGRVLTSSRWQKICTKFHRVNPQTCHKCIESDTILANKLTEGEKYAIYRCRNGLVNAAAPILIAGEHIANFLVGQFLFKQPDCEYFRKQAREHGFDETTYIEALSEVPVIAEDRIKLILEFLVGFAEFVGEMGLTQIRQSEAANALAGSNEKYLEAIIKTSRDGMFVLDSDGNFEFGNDATFEILGWTMAELIGNSFMKVMPRDVHEFVSQRWDELCRGEGEPYEVDIVTKDRKRRSLFVSHSLMDIAGNRKYCIVIKDVTARKAVEDVLRQSEETYRTIFDAANDAIFVHDIENGDIIDVNQRMCEMCGCTPDAARRLSVEDFSAGKPPYAQEDAMQWIRKASDEGPQLFEWLSKDMSGRLFWTEVNLKRVVIEGEDRLLAIMRDISRRKSAEEELEKYRKHLEELVKDRTDELRREISERKHLEERRVHLNLVLRAIRNVNQLITKEHDRGRLLQGACDNLIETRGYHSAWIALIDESGTFVTTAEAGLGEAFVPMVKRLKHGELIECTQKALLQSGVVVTDDPISACVNCPLAEQHSGRRVKTIRLEHGGRIYGLLSVAVPAELAVCREERALFAEVAGDIAFALHAIELDEKRKHAEEALKESEDRLRIRLDYILSPDKDVKNISLTNLIDLEDLQQIQDAFAAANDVASIISDIDGKPITKASNFCGVCEIIRSTEKGDINCVKSDKILGAKAKALMKPTYGKCFSCGFVDASAPIIVGGKHIANWLIGQSNAIGVDKNRIETYAKEIDADTDEMLDAFEKMPEISLAKFEEVLDLLWLMAKKLSALGHNNLVLAKDVTERKRVEEALYKSVLELERSNAELEQFAYVASHDLQEPLRMVSSYVQLLARRYEGELDSDADDFIEFAVDGAKRMQTLIGDLLVYSRVGTRGEPFKPIDCTLVLEQVLMNLEIAIGESGAVVTHNALPNVTADSSQLVQLFQNLIENAIKFCCDEPPCIHIAAEQKDGEWEFFVADNGIGIDPEFFERIFVIFQRLHGRDEYSGTGIGLAICKKIVERHGGRMWVESEPGQGATFYFTIPVEGDDY